MLLASGCLHRCLYIHVSYPQAYKFKLYAMFYLGIYPDSTPVYFKQRFHEASRVGRLAVWLGLSGLSMIVFTASFTLGLMMLSGFMQATMPFALINTSIFLFCRIFISYAQVGLVSMRPLQRYQGQGLVHSANPGSSLSCVCSKDDTTSAIVVVPTPFTLLVLSLFLE